MTASLAQDARDCRVWADPVRFHQIMTILLANALKFSGPGGSVQVRTSNDAGPLVIRVIDNGAGIAPAALPKLFSAFEHGGPEVHRRYGGMGLGLAIAKSLVEMHRGTISARSEGLGKGATFTLRLNAIQPVARPSEPAPPAALRILLLEDHADTRVVMNRLLSSLGCKVTPTGTVQEALQLANAQEFDMLVSDIGLPDGSGTDVMRRMREERPVKGIAISGLGQEDDLKRSLDAGFSTHLTKPITFQALREAIQTASAC